MQIADVLEQLENVTAKVQDATRGLDARAANERRRQTLTELELACENTSQQSGNPLKCEAVTLYGGGQFWLYQYRRYDDVRLVFAPEGGDRGLRRRPRQLPVSRAGASTSRCCAPTKTARPPRRRST